MHRNFQPVRGNNDKAVKNIREVSITDNSQSINAQLKISALGISSSRIREIIIKRNDELIQNNLKIATSLITFNGRETNRALEDIFIKNYLLVSSTMYTNMGFHTTRLVIYIIGYLARTKYAFKIVDFINKFEKESFHDIVSICETQMQSTEVTTDYSNVVLVKPSDVGLQMKRMGGAFARTVAQSFNNTAIILIVNNFTEWICNCSKSTWTPITKTCSIQQILNNDLPSSQCYGGEVIVNLVKLFYENVMKNETEKKTTKPPPRQREPANNNPQPTTVELSLELDGFDA